MGYRRPHHRRSHTRTNADGSKSYVKASDVKGHNYNKKTEHYSSSSSSNDYDGLDKILFYISLACFICFILGLILRWSDALWYLLIFLPTHFWLYKRNKF